MSTQANLPGARESGAGDDFHILWATRKVLRLLRADGDLELVRLEGFTPADPAAAAGDLTQGADVVEYFGGRSFAQARSVVVSQLKYSHRHPTQPWTAARMTAARRANGPTVTRRLAELFLALRASHDAEDVRRKLRLRLVSNQPPSATFARALDEAQAKLAAYPGLGANGLLQSLSPTSRTEITRLRNAAQLTDAGFPEFLICLDLSECGSESRSVIEAELASELYTFLPGADTPVERLYRRVQREALPEGEQSNGLAREHVLAALGVDSEAALQPVPSRLQRLDDPIPTPEPGLVAAAITSASHNRILVHGDAGVGKTTTVTLLENALPSGSVVITYDCFGAGSYLDPSEARHLPERALFQMINELALRCGTPLLLRPPPIAPELWRIFRQRLDEAAAVFADSERLLVIAIDAADNAVFAARERGDNCFVEALWDLALPENVQLVVTARTHRVDILRAPSDVDTFELRGFDVSASTLHLQSRFNEATLDEGRAFHERSAGNPRVQFYVLDPERAEHLDVHTALVDSQRTPTEIFDDLIQSAVEQAPDPAQARRLLADLVCLSRPVRVATFAAVSGLTLARAEAFAHGLAPGAVISNETISFRDEDFEKHLRALVGEGAETESHSRLASYFLGRDATDGEAAMAVAEHLFRAGEYDRLVSHTLDTGEPMSVRDPVVRAQVYRRRLAFALRASLAIGSKADAFRLTVLAADAARSDSALETLVRDRPDLAMKYGDPEGVAAIYMRQENSPWRGPLHFRVAAMYGREGKGELAEQHFRHAIGWVREARRRNEETAEDERAHGGDWSLRAEDVAAGAEAISWDRGLGAALSWLATWRPPEVVFSSIRILALALAKRADPTDLLDEIRASRMHVRAEAAFLASLWWESAAIPSDWVAELAPRVERALARNRIVWNDRGSFGEIHREDEWAMRFAELAAAARVDGGVVLRLVARAAPPPPAHPPGEWDDLTRHDLSLRRAALEAALDGRVLSVDDIVPPSLRSVSDSQSRDASQRRAYIAAFSGVVPAYVLRARVLTRRTNLRQIDSQVRENIVSRVNDATHRWSKYDPRYRLWARTTADAVLRTRGGDPAPLVRDLADAAIPIIGAAARDVWLDLGEAALRTGRHDSLGAALVDRAATYVSEHDLPASDRVAVLLRAADVVDRADSELASDYYDRAAKAAAGIDDDAITLLRLHAYLADMLAAHPPDTAASLALRATHVIELFEPKVSDIDQLPYAETLRAVTHLHPPSGFATASRWDDERRLRLSAGAAATVNGAFDAGFIDGEIASVLVRIGGERLEVASNVQTFLSALASAGPSARPALHRTLNDIVQWIIRDVPIHRRGAEAEAIVALAESSGVGALPSIEALRDFRSAVSAIAVAPAESADSVAVFAGDAGAPKPFTGTLGERLEQAADNYASDSDIVTVILQEADATDVARRATFLQELVDLPSAHRAVRWHPEAIVEGIQLVLDRWSTSGAVASWAAEGIPALVEHHFLAFVAYEQTASRTLHRLFALPFVVDAPSLLLRGLASHLDDLSSAQLYGIAYAIGSSLDYKDVEGVLDWSMKRLEPSTASQEQLLPESAPAVLAAWLSALFGNVEKAVRWRAAHAARTIATRNSEVLTALVEKCGARKAGPFMSSRLPFYWISARQWLFMVIARIAYESPDDLRNHLDSLLSAALDNEFPHAAIRDFAKRAASRVIERAPGIDASVIERLALANEPVACFSKRDRAWNLDEGPSERETRFHFDIMDTIPYWYTPLGRVFGATGNEIAARADKWITDELGFTEEDVYEDQRELSRGSTWERTRNDHGSIPPVEVLRIYLQYHAMLLVAGQLIDERRPVASDEWDDLPGPWANWLSSHVESMPGHWLSDLRAPSPIESLTYQVDVPKFELWAEPSARDFDEQLFVHDRGQECITAHAYVSMLQEDRRESVNVRCALVSPETARALMRALQTTDAHNFFIPYEDWNDHGGGRSEIRFGEFRLEGFLRESRRYDEGLDEHDPLRRIAFSFDRPGDHFLRWAAANLSPTGLEVTRTDGSAVAWTVLWSDEIGDEGEYDRTHRTSGDRTFVPAATFREFLTHVERDLLVEVQMERRRTREYGRRGADEEREETRQSRIYLIRRDGSVETV